MSGLDSSPTSMVHTRAERKMVLAHVIGNVVFILNIVESPLLSPGLGCSSHEGLSHQRF
jgi:hypothetical protein